MPNTVAPKIIAALMLPLVVNGLLAGCAYSSPQQQEANACQIIGPKSLIGGLAGAAGGAALGAAAGKGQGAAIGAGIGLVAGMIAGHVADTQDCAAAQAALQSQIMQARANGTIAWRSPSGNNGQFTVRGDVYAGPSGSQCRRAEIVSQPGSPAAANELVVCRQPGGDYVYASR